MAGADATDGDWPVGSVPFFAPLAAPEISSTSHQALVKWRRERREYESKLRARCRIYGEDYAAVVQSINDSFNRDLLDGFCELRLGINSADVTDDLLSAEIERIVSHVKNDSLPDIKQLFKQKLRLNMAESNVDARVLDYFVRFKTLVDENGLGECFSGADGAREKCKRLIASLRPESLKADVKQFVRCTHKSAASDANQLFKLVIDKAKE
ncbi:hypothetical protein PF003_g24447 [Phytophthora fragariae]|nr:hypothetical protein PF003_g24447 [Phytophthora fragariae]